MYYTNGNFYDGEWKNNCKNGWGTMNWKNCCQKYEGTWKHDMPNGFGSYLWLLNNSEHSFLRNRYEGNFVNGTRQGLGTYYYANGSKYEGDWNDNIKEGCAIFTEENGNVITGFFEVDRLFKRIFNGAVLNVTAEANTLIFQNLDDVDARSILEDGISKHNLDDPFRPLDTNTNIDLEGIPGTQDNLQVTQSNLGHTMTDIGMKKQGTLNQLAEGDRTSQANLMQSNAFGQSNMKDTLNVEHHENGNNKRGRKKHKGPIDINPNPYFNILNLDDLYDTQPSLKVKTYPWVMKMLLSRHSDLIRLYSYYRKKYEPLDENKEIGTGLRLFSFWRFLIECRLLNINLSIPSFNRLYSVNKRNTYTQRHDAQILQKKIDRLHVDTERIQREELITVPQQEREFEEDIDYFIFENLSADLESYHDGNRIMLFRNFVDALLRAIYLKYDDLECVHTKLNKLLSEQINPIIQEKKIPKALFADEDILQEKVAVLISQYDEFFEEQIADIILRNDDRCDPRDRKYLSINDLITLQRDCGMLESNECLQILMNIIERYHDPETTFINMHRKREKLKKGHEKYDKMLYKLLAKKVEYEMMDFEVKENICLFIIKKVTF